MTKVRCDFKVFPFRNVQWNLLFIKKKKSEKNGEKKAQFPQKILIGTTFFNIDYKIRCLSTN